MVESQKDCFLENPQQKLLAFPKDYFELFMKESSRMKKQKRVYTKKSTDKIKRWTNDESKLYEEFIKQYNYIFEEAGNKRITNIFIFMSEFIGTKSASQCRSHHQKFYRRFKDGEVQDNAFKRKKNYKKKGENLQNSEVQTPVLIQNDGKLGWHHHQSQNESMQTMDESLSNKLTDSSKCNSESSKCLEKMQAEQQNLKKESENNFRLPSSIEDNGEMDESNSFFREPLNEFFIEHVNEFDDFKNKDDNFMENHDDIIGKYIMNHNFVEDCLKFD